MLAPLLAIIWCYVDVGLTEPTGSIEGFVVDGSHGGKPLEGAQVVLRAGAEGELVPVAKTTTDRLGRFVFEGLPLESDLIYVPGADRDGVHYPSKRVQLATSNRNVQTRILAFAAVRTPRPLQTVRHDIDVIIEPFAAKVTERLLIANRTETTYIGQPMADRQGPTLRLSIPEDFDRVTFSKEFYGRRFQIIDHRPVTDIPWPPGERELEFTYCIPLEKLKGQFHRQLDLPSSKIRLCVRGERCESVSCNLPRLSQGADRVLFESVQKTLPTGFLIELEFGGKPFHWTAWARWAAVLMLGALILATRAYAASAKFGQLHNRGSTRRGKSARLPHTRMVTLQTVHKS
jgi:hypothetical protein